MEQAGGGGRGVEGTHLPDDLLFQRGQRTLAEKRRTIFARSAPVRSPAAQLYFFPFIVLFFTVFSPFRSKPRVLVADAHS